MIAALERRAGVLTFAWVAVLQLLTTNQGAHLCFHISCFTFQPLRPPLQIHSLLRERAWKNFILDGPFIATEVVCSARLCTSRDRQQGLR